MTLYFKLINKVKKYFLLLKLKKKQIKLGGNLELINISIDNFGKNIFIGNNTYINNSTIGNNVLLKNNSFISLSKLEEYVTLHNGVALKDTIIGAYTYIAEKTFLSNTKTGKYCSIGPKVTCCIGKHPTKDFVSTHPMFYSTQKQAQISLVDKDYFEEYAPKTELGNDVWIGQEAMLMDGVKIGDGAIIGARAVVTKDIPPYAVAVGVPAKVIRYRFEKKEIDFLLNLKWWDKDFNWIKNNSKYFRDIKTLMEQVRG
jgi:acetyltransferase-like isoleucine patch superfamily enzyme